MVKCQVPPIDLLLSGLPGIRKQDPCLPGDCRKPQSGSELFSEGLRKIFRSDITTD